MVTKVTHTQTCKQRHTHREPDKDMSIAEMVDVPNIIINYYLHYYGQDVSCSVLSNVSEKLEPHYCVKTSLYLRHVVHLSGCRLFLMSVSQIYGCIPLLTNLIYSSFYFRNRTKHCFLGEFNLFLKQNVIY